MKFIIFLLNSRIFLKYLDQDPRNRPNLDAAQSVKKSAEEQCQLTLYRILAMRAYLSGYSSATEAGYGDVFVFEVEFTLPAVTDADKFDANLEIFSFQPTTRK